MTYSVDLRERVVAFCREGGSKTEAAKRFGVHRLTVYAWLKAPSLEPKKHGRRQRKLDWEALQKHVDTYPDKTLKERAAAFGVAANAIWYALCQMKISNKKTFRYAERDLEKRIAFLRQLRELAPVYGFDNLVYVDESGFEASSCRQRGWSKVGQEVFGDRSGNKRPRTSLIAAKRGRSLIAPVFFQGSTDADWFNQWLEHHLFPVLSEPSVIIMDNARFHKTEPTLVLFDNSPHVVLFLPPYSPDFNPIEQDFANIKKRRQFAPTNFSLDDVLNAYVSYLG